ncbi:hypothetical protein ANN_26726 [Periplaneta americana]|uniref:Uncharacterized protein n=1 Tax=Periplaneta americana TaxID=6978 RepID=A0ABQ8RYV2_PERAM|nr:hypothetical protein ANN_26726 [Periplaneta americana]
MKALLYQNSVDTEEDLAAQIAAGVVRDNAHDLQWSLIRRMILCRQGNGGHFEQLLRSLRGQKIWLEKDFSVETRKKRKLLIPYLKEARKRGQFAMLSFDKLIINGKSYDLDYCQRNFNSDNNWILKTRRSEETQSNDFSTEQRNNTGGKNARKSADYEERRKRQQPSVCRQSANSSTCKQLVPEIDVQATSTLHSKSTDGRGNRISQESSRRESSASTKGSCQNPGPSTAIGLLEQVSFRKNDLIGELNKTNKKTGKIDDLFTKIKKYFTHMPQMTPDYERVVCIGVLSNDPTDFVLEDWFRMAMMTFEVRMCEDYSLRDIFIIDLAHYTLGHVTKVTFPCMKKAEACIMKSGSTRLSHSLVACMRESSSNLVPRRDPSVYQRNGNRMVPDQDSKAVRLEENHVKTIPQYIPIRSGPDQLTEHSCPVRCSGSVHPTGLHQVLLIHLRVRQQRQKEQLHEEELADQR